MKAILRILALAGLIVDAIGAADWPEFRGSTGQGISTATNILANWNATNNVTWKIAVPGKGWSSPVIAGPRLFLTTATTDAQKQVSLRVLCFDSVTGKLEWDREIFRPGEEIRSVHAKNSLASPTPMLKGDRLFVHFGHMGTACLEPSGGIVWTNTEINYSPVHGNGGSPILHEGLLIFNCDAAADPFITALDAQNGKIRWKTPRLTEARNKFSFSTPLIIEVAGTAQVISPASGFVGGYDPITGKELWRVRYGEGYSVIPRPVFANGLIFVSSGYDRAILYAVKTGAKGDATDTHIAWTQKKGAPNTPSPLAVGDELYFVSDAGIASCVNARTGETHWSERLGGDFSASPVLAEGRIYFQNEAGVGYVVKASKQYELIAKNELGERTLASPAVIDNSLFLRSESHLWRLGTAQK